MSNIGGNVSEDIEEEEEELLVYADFDTVIDESMFQQDTLFKVIGLNSEEPFLQIGTQTYSGKWYDGVGTNLFFETESAPPPVDPVFSETPSTLLNYKFRTRKCLELSRVFINSKHKQDDDLSLLQEDNRTETQNKSPESSKEESLEDKMEISEPQVAGGVNDVIQ